VVSVALPVIRFTNKIKNHGSLITALLSNSVRLETGFKTARLSTYRLFSDNPWLNKHHLFAKDLNMRFIFFATPVNIQINAIRFFNEDGRIF